MQAAAAPLLVNNNWEPDASIEINQARTADIHYKTGTRSR